MLYFNEDAVNFFLRTCMVVFLFLALHLTIVIGPVGFLYCALVIQSICFAELLIIFSKSQNYIHSSFYLPLAFYLYIVINYFLFGTFLSFRHACIEDACNVMFTFHLPNHIMISYVFYLAGFLFYIIRMPTENIKSAINYYSWLHSSFLLISVPTYMIVQNMLYGLFWLVIPLVLVGVNDLFAYLFGKTVGKTPLIKLSPNKTWEGYIGAAVSTVILGHFVASYIVELDYFMCPVNLTTRAETTCVYSKDEEVSLEVKRQLYIHTIVISMFASTIAPFGGFFASGFKRAYGIKNFSSLLPGHGGVLDRFDCQFLMGVFVNVYIRTFVRNERAEIILDAH